MVLWKNHKVGQLALIAVIFLHTFPAFGQWTRVEGGGLPAFQQVWAMDMCDKNTVIINVRGIDAENYSEHYYQTTDNGGTWVEIPFPPGETRGGSDISMIDRDHIWVIGAFRKIYATEDRGVTWDCQFDNESQSNFLNYIQMFDMNNGVAMGDATSGEAPVILKTTDGGKNWISVNQQEIGAYSYDEWRCVSFPTMDTGYFRAPDRKIWKTIDGGETWTDTGKIGSDIVKFYDAEFGLFSMINGFGRTLDGMVTVADSIDGFYYKTGFSFAPGHPSNVWVAGSQKLFFSSDSGRTFTLQHEILQTEDLSINNVQFADSAFGFLLCSRALYKTRNGGGVYTSVRDRHPDSPLKFFLDQNYPNPFNSETEIQFSMERNEHVFLTLYDITGKKIAILADGAMDAGMHRVKWDGRDYSGREAPSGVYLYSLRAGGSVQHRKLLLVK